LLGRLFGLLDVFEDFPRLHCLLRNLFRAEAYRVCFRLREVTDLGLDRLREVIRPYRSAITAFSAGVDSTLVAVVAQQELGDNALAATAVSASLAPSELEDALQLAAALGLNHRLVSTHEVEDPRYATNPVDRCYFCKTHLYTQLEALMQETGFRYVLNGLNVDDLGDWRPGARAAAERESYVRSPLHEAGMGKAAIREAARELGLPNWDKPALACLSSRVPYGMAVTPEKLARIGQAEAALRHLGFRQLRVRHFDDRARVEIAPNELGRVTTEGLGSRIEAELLALGFPAVEIDPRGYRSGSLNEGVVPLPVVSA
jgi:pyridinium-3,5-biscarboxylic acid mononucleotide sulfurtransferase